MNSLTIAWRQSQAAEKERLAEEKKHTTWGVYPHAQWIGGEARETGQGFVAREMRDGLGLGVPYSRMKPLKVFKSRALADKHGNKLTFG